MNKGLHECGAISLVIFVVIDLMDQVLGRLVGPIKFLPFFEPRDTKSLGGFINIKLYVLTEERVFGGWHQTSANSGFAHPKVVSH